MKHGHYKVITALLNVISSVNCITEVALLCRVCDNPPITFTLYSTYLKEIKLKPKTKATEVLITTTTTTMFTKNKKDSKNIPVQAFDFFFCSVFMDPVMFVLFLNGNSVLYMDLIWGVLFQFYLN